MKKLNNKKGFTLAELLIVVAIIAVLAGISIPIFNAQLKKANLATNQANARAAYAATVAEMLTNNETSATYKYTVSTAKAESTSSTGSNSVAGTPQTWSVNTASDLTNGTKSVWYVSITSAGATYTYED